MRFIFYVAFILFTIFCVVIAVSNGELVSFSLNPFPLNITMPAYGLVFMGIFIGLFGGWIVSIAGGIRHARRHRIADKNIKALELQLKSLKSENIDLSNSPKRGKSSSE